MINLNYLMDHVLYHKLLTPETMKLIRRTKSKITKDKNSENVPNLEVTEVVLVHWKSHSKLVHSRVSHTFA